MAQQPRRGSTTLLWGVLFGIILALLIVLDRLILASQPRHTGPGAPFVSFLLSRGVLYLVGLALCFLAGLLAARRSGAVESGVFAGLIVGGLAGLTNLVFVVLAADAANRRLQRAAVARHALPPLHAAIGAGMLSALVGFVAVTLIGAGAGAIGGLAGRGSGWHGQPFQRGGPPTFGYPPPSATHSPVGGYVPPMPPSESTPVPPSPSSSSPPTPPGYIPGSDAPTISTS